MKNIYLIEGLPGSGKTTLAKRLSTYFESRHVKHKVFNEGDLHPVDLAWIAIFSKSDYDKLLKTYPQLETDIFKYSKVINNTYYVAYTKVNIAEDSKDFYTYCSTYEIYQTHDIKKFLDTHLNLWHTFLNADQDDTIYIFECIFLQNHINELILKHDLSKQEIIDYFQRFSHVFKDHQVTLFYINQIDVQSSIYKIANERKTTDKTLYKDWIDHVIEYFEKTTYGKQKGYLGFDGAIKYFIDRKEIELDIIKQLDIKSYVIDLDDDYEFVFNHMIFHIKSIA